jgi:hypothetical protein
MIGELPRPSIVFSSESPVYLFGKDKVASAMKARTIKEVARNGSRTDKLKTTVGLVTERAAAKETCHFINTYLQNGTNPSLREEAEIMLESLAFVGKTELDKACEAIGSDWLTYLEEDPSRQILVVPGLSQKNDQIKSDAFILEKVLAHIGEDAVGERIVGDIAQLRADPDNVRVVILDDWILTGKQLSAVCASFARNTAHDRYIEKMEIDLVIGTPNMLINGFQPTHLGGEVMETFTHPLPVKARWVTQVSDHSGLENIAYLTGFHSMADYGFFRPIEDMFQELHGNGIEVKWPLLVCISDTDTYDGEYSLVKKLYSKTNER